MTTYVVIIPARNESEFIGRVIESLKHQLLPPSEIIVVDDSSTDGTGRIARELGATVLSLQRVNEEYLPGLPHIARVINKGLENVGNNIEYVMISGADSIYPLNYVKEIINRVNGTNIVVASGIAESETSHLLGVRGSGRIIEMNWFKEVGGRYPEYWGFEAWLVYRALKDGKSVKIFNDLRFKLLRKTSMTPKKAYLYGLSCKALDYWPPYFIGRVLLQFIKSPQNGVAMLRGFFREVKKYRDLEGFTSSFQKRILLNALAKILYTGLGAK